MPGTTTKGFPYPLTSDNNATAGSIQSLATTIDPFTHSVGDIKASIRTTAETGWALMNGQTITNAQTLNTVLWSVAPTAWRSGANLVLPNWCDGYVLRGGLEAGATIGASTGANTTALTTTELPVHTHTVNHSHTTSGSSSGAGAHGHSINHTHGTGSADSQGAHLHNIGSGSTLLYNGPYGGSANVPTGYFTLSGGFGSNGDNGAHGHNITTPSHTGNTGSDPGNHTHTCSGTTSTDAPTTSSAGTGTAFSTRGKSGWLNFFIKL